MTLARSILFAAALVSIATTLAIVYALIRETISFFGEVNAADFLFGTEWSPLFKGDQQSFGVLPLVWGTIYLTAIGLVVAVPLGLLCGMYLAEFAPRRVRKVVKPVLEILAGVPTIVFGYFALTFFTPTVLRDALWFCDLCTGTTGEPVEFDDRIASIRARHGPGSVNVLALDSGGFEALRGAYRRTELRLAGLTVLSAPTGQY